MSNRHMTRCSISFNYYRNANQKNNEVSPHTSPKTYQHKVYKFGDVEKKESFYTLCGNVYMRKYFLKVIKLKLEYDPAVPLLSIYPKRWKTLISKDTCTPVFIVALFTITKIWKPLRNPTTDEWIKNCYLYWHWATMKKKHCRLYQYGCTIMLSEISEKDE